MWTLPRRGADIKRICKDKKRKQQAAKVVEIKAKAAA
jgi:phage-related protein